MRVWIALGVRAITSLGWQWDRPRRTDPDRIARHGLMLAIAPLLDLAAGARREEADWRGIPPGRPRRSRTPPPARARRESVFARGLAWRHVQVIRGTRWWRALWLLPEALPDPPRGLTIIRHVAPPGGAYAEYLPLSGRAGRGEFPSHSDLTGEVWRDVPRFGQVNAVPNTCHSDDGVILTTEESRPTGRVRPPNRDSSALASQ